MEKTAQDLFGSIATQERPTTETSVNSQTWAKWLGLELVDDEVERMVKAAAQWATAVKEGKSPRWLVMLGTSGCGKTHIAKRLWKWLQTHREDFSSRAEYDPRWIYWPGFMDKTKTDTSCYGVLNDMPRWKYLALDDVLAERQSDWTVEKLHNLIGQRARKWTIITSNLSMMGMAKLDKRIASRMLRDKSIVTDVTTTDYNLR